jgi:hypothetical protein
MLVVAKGSPGAEHRGMKLQHLLASALACCALASCAQTPPAPAASAPEPQAARLAREMQSLIGPARCRADSDCRTLAVGAKACGGPGGYWAWSTQGTDGQKLQALAQRQAEAAAAENTRSGMASNCAVVTDPGARCDAGRCVLREGGAGAAAR